MGRLKKAFLKIVYPGTGLFEGDAERRLREGWPPLQETYRNLIRIGYDPGKAMRMCGVTPGDLDNDIDRER